MKQTTKRMPVGVLILFTQKSQSYNINIVFCTNYKNEQRVVLEKLRAFSPRYDLQYDRQKSFDSVVLNFIKLEFIAVEK